MRNLVLILIAFIAVVTFIRAFDNPKNENSRDTEPARFIELRTNSDIPAGSPPAGRARAESPADY
jgi:hypothetical protein